MQILSDNLVEKLDEYGDQFQNAKPFRHVMIAPFFEPSFADAMLGEFPAPVESQMLSEFGRKSRKYACHDVRSIGATYRALDDYISSPAFAEVMQRVTGIEGLLYDPEYHGAGTHDNFSGQGMDAHVDFNLHRTTGYHRRFNAIIYLNKEWEDAWGGALELHTNPWDFERDKTIAYPPLFNHCVLFETNEYSWHGFKPVQKPKGRELSRKSFTIYMYTKDRPKEEIAPKHGTIYVPAGPPQQYQAGHMLTTKDVDDLTKEFKRRNSYLQGMYGRESKLMEQVEVLRKLRANVRIPTIGYVRQSKPAVGIQAGNNSIKKEASMFFDVLRGVESVSIRGRLPAHIANARVSYKLNGARHPMDIEESERKFVHTLPINASPGDAVVLELDVEGVPRRAESENKQDTLLVIDEIQFD